MMYFCYIDESGTPQIPGNSSHYVLCGLSIPISKWKICERQIHQIKRKYGLDNAEIHTGWILRTYLEQSRIHGFENLSYEERKAEVLKERAKEIYRIKQTNNKSLYKQTRKNFRFSEPYIHLTKAERFSFIKEVAKKVGSWTFARIFAEGIDKSHFNPLSKHTVDEVALEQIVSRFEHYMGIIDKTPISIYGALIHDNNITVAERHTKLMKQFHLNGTLWTDIKHITETPLFVNSELTSMVQIADMCSYIIRRYFENHNTELMNCIKSRFDRNHDRLVGVRHYTSDNCECEICSERREIKKKI